MLSTPRRLYSINETAHLIGAGRTKVYELINRGQLELVKLDNKSLVPDESIDAFVQSLRGASDGPSA